jgi:hypothetical protein
MNYTEAINWFENFSFSFVLIEKGFVKFDPQKRLPTHLLQSGQE